MLNDQEYLAQIIYIRLKIDQYLINPDFK